MPRGQSQGYIQGQWLLSLLALRWALRWSCACLPSSTPAYLLPQQGSLRLPARSGRPREVGSASGFAATADVNGVRARFEAEPVFAALQSVADFLAAGRAVRGLLSARACAEGAAGGAHPRKQQLPGWQPRHGLGSQRRS